VVLIGVSYLTAAPAADKLTGLTFATVTADHRAESRSSWTRQEVLLSGMVLLLILAAYLYFRG
jgi:SSS family solute:Na+ symporter